MLIKKVLNMMKDELGDDEMVESVNVCAKLYSFTKKTPDGKILESTRAKGVKKCVKKKCLHHQDFKDAIVDGKITRYAQRVFRSHRHYVLTEAHNKTAIRARDDKTIWTKGCLSMTYQYGSPTLKKMLEN